MKRVYTLLFVAILSLTAVSCFKDKGNYDYTPENRFEVTLQPEINNNEETYWVIKPTSAPDSVPFTVSVTQTLAADSTNLEVSWFILENETEERDTAYGFRHTFHFPEGADRYYEVSLFVHDDLTGLSYRDDFSVRTRDPFSFAWVVLHGEEGNRRLGFLDYPVSNNYQDSASVVEDGYMSLRNIRRFEDAEFVAFTPSFLGDDNLLVLAPDSAWVLDPYTMRMYYTNNKVYYGDIPVDFSFIESFAGPGGYSRSVLISETRKFYVGDAFCYLYEVGLDQDVPTDYTATAAYTIPGLSIGANLVWDGVAHRFYFQEGLEQTGSMGTGRLSSTVPVLRNISEIGSMPLTDAELENMELLWLGKGIPDMLEGRDETATAIMRENNGTIHFIHFAFEISKSGSGTTSYDMIFELERDVKTGEHEFTEDTHFAVSNAFASYLFFTDGTDIYRLNNSGSVPEFELIASLNGLTTLDGEPVGSINEIVDMKFRVDYEPTGVGDENFATRLGARVLTVAYNTADGGGITEIYLTTGGDVEDNRTHISSYTGFGPIVDIDYMARMMEPGINVGARDYID